MKMRSRVSFLAMSFLFALGTGVAFAASSTACMNACNAEISACLAEAGSSKSACLAEGKACKKSCEI